MGRPEDHLRRAERLLEEAERCRRECARTGDPDLCRRVGRLVWEAWVEALRAVDPDLPDDKDAVDELLCEIEEPLSYEEAGRLGEGDITARIFYEECYEQGEVETCRLPWLDDVKASIEFLGQLLRSGRIPLRRHGR